MALIPRHVIATKDTLSLRLDRMVHERLKAYAEFIQSPKDYVIGQALQRLFRTDKAFGAWLETRAHGVAPHESSVVTLTRAREADSTTPIPAPSRTPTERRI